MLSTTPSILLLVVSIVGPLCVTRFIVLMEDEKLVGSRFAIPGN